MFEGDERQLGVIRYHDAPPAPDGYRLAEAPWGRCIPLVDRLVAAGVRAYCPVAVEIRRGARRGRIRVRRPAFGAYIWIDPTAAIPPLLAAHVRPFYRDGFWWFSAEEVARLREEEAAWPVVGAERRDKLAKGQAVRVTAGPFIGLVGSVQHDRGERVRLSLGAMILDVPPFMVEAVDG